VYPIVPSAAGEDLEMDDGAAEADTGMGEVVEDVAEEAYLSPPPEVLAADDVMAEVAEPPPAAGVGAGQTDTAIPPEPAPAELAPAVEEVRPSG
jgi:hypothetical protein